MRHVDVENHDIRSQGPHRSDGSASIRLIVSASIGVAPAVWYSINGAAAVSGAVVTVRATDFLRTARAKGVREQVVVLKLMPLSNATQMTDDERALFKRWFEAGARTE